MPTSSDRRRALAAAAIRADGVGKRYELGRTIERGRTARDAVGELATRTRRLLRGGAARKATPEEFWALRDVSFEVARGEAVGLVGGNGAGKSTLLKLLSRITAPTTGRIEIRGRVGSLLEVGTGFHPDLSGRENTFLNGAILGMRQVEIARKFDEIVAFAEVERFIDTPVKRYSSGMYLRLAFAVAAHLEPEVLLVDEVLAVGDAAFQKKCLGKMGDVMELGRTVVFVSHNMAAIQTLCQRALWLRAGEVAEDGPASRVVGHYLRAAHHALTEQHWPDAAFAPGNDEVRLRRVAVKRTPDDAAVAGELDDDENITTRTPFRLEFEFWNLRPGARVGLSLNVYNEQGIMVFNALPVTERAWSDRPYPAGLFRDVCHVPGDLLNDGTYRVELLVTHDDARVVYRHDDLLAFEVHDSADLRGSWFGRWPGVVRPVFPWTTECVLPGLPGEEPSPAGA